MTKGLALRRVSNGLWFIIRTLLIASLAFLILNPVFIKGITAFKDVADYADPTVFYIPKHPTTEYLKTMLEFLDYAPTLLRSLAFTTINALLQTLACAFTAYSLARFKYKLRKAVFIMVILTMVVPSQTTLIPLFLQFKFFDIRNILSALLLAPPSGGTDLINTPWPILLLSMTALGLKNGLFIFIFRQYFRNLPVVLEEAAYIDGCNPMRAYFSIVAPCSVTMLVTVFLFSFVWIWNDNLFTSYLAPDMGIMSSKLNGIGWRIGYYLGSTALDSTGFLSSVYGSVGVLLHMIPVLLLYIFAQKFFIQSIERSGIVG